MNTQHAHHIRIGMTKGFVRPSEIVVAAGRPERTSNGSPIAAASGLIGAMVLGAVVWGGVLLAIVH